MSDKLTGPMRVLLLETSNDGVLRVLYPGGQQRMIVTGLVRRGLVEATESPYHFRLTDEGAKVARQLGNSSLTSTTRQHSADDLD